jgi:hypothetical protein
MSDRNDDQTVADLAWDRLGNFTARIVADRRHHDGAGGGAVEFEIEVRVAGGPPRRGTIAAADFDNDTRLLAALRTIGRSRLRFATGRDATRRVRCALLAASDTGEETTYGHTGWAVIDGADHFLMPGSAVGPTRPTVALSGAATGLAGYGFVDLEPPEEKQAFGLLRDGLLRAMPPHVAYPAVAHAFLPVIARHLPARDRYLLFLRGQTGTYKTTYAQLLMALWGGEFAVGTVPASWSSTVNALEGLGFCAKDALLLVDDYKPAVVDAAQVTRLIQNYADGTARDRLTSAAELQGGKRIRAHLLATGEDASQGEASVRARMLILDVAGGDARLDRITDLQRHPRLLAGLMPRFVAWVMAHPSLAARVEAAFDDARCQILGRPELTGVRNPGRIAQNLATNAVAFAVLVDWLEDAGAITTSGAAALRADYDGLRGRLLACTTRGVQEQRANILFVERLGALLDGGTHALAASARAAADPTRMEVGWREGDVVYLTTGAFAAVGCGTSTFAWSAEAVRRQLQDDGMLADRGTDQLTVRRQFHGRQIRVTALRAEVLGFGGADDGGSVIPLPRTIPAGQVA